MNVMLLVGTNYKINSRNLHVLSEILAKLIIIHLHKTIGTNINANKIINID